MTFGDLAVRELAPDFLNEATDARARSVLGAPVALVSESVSDRS